MSKVNVNPALVEYIEREILPRYDHFDQAHQRDHVTMVIQQSLDIASRLDVDTDMVYAIAAYHDTGLCEGREHHHEVSAQIIKADHHLRQWFTEEQILVMADAAEDHRASAKQAPRTIYGRIVAEADRFIDPDTIVKVYLNPDALPEIHRERELARLAFVAGVPTAIPYDVVRIEGGGYGSVFELVGFTDVITVVQD